jgi:hypothetical protein
MLQLLLLLLLLLRFWLTLNAWDPEDISCNKACTRNLNDLN